MPTEKTLVAVTGILLVSFATLSSISGAVQAPSGPSAEIETEVGEELSPSEGRFFESVDVDVINLQVVVTDKKGNPVKGLSQDDFRVFENGREMRLTNFYAVAPVESRAPIGSAATTTARSVEHPERLTEIAEGTERRANIVIFVDNLNIRPENRHRLFLSLRKYLAEETDSGLDIMIVSMGRKVVVELPFSADRQRVLETLDEVEQQSSLHALLDGNRRMFMNRLQTSSVRQFIPRRRIGPDGELGTVGDPHFDDAIRVALELANSVRDLAEQRYRKVRSTLEAIERFCDVLGGVAGRKALVYLSDGLPIRPADPLYEAWTGKYQNWVLANENDIRSNSSYPEAGSVFSRTMSAMGSVQFDLSQQVRKLTMKANDNRVVFYPISTSDVLKGSRSAAVSGAGIGTGSGSMMYGSDALESFGRDATLLRLAEETGGLAMTRSANLGKLLTRLSSDFENFYSLGYQPWEEDLELTADDGTEAAELGATEIDQKTRRKLEVKVRGEDLKVRHGRGYLQKNWRQQLGSMTAASVLFELQANPLQVRIEPLEQRVEGKRVTVPIMVKVPFELLRMVHRDGYYTAQLTALVVVQDEKGGVSETTRIDFPIRIPDQRILEALAQVAGYVIELEVDRGATRIALGLRDHFGRVDSTVKLDLMVGEETL